MLKLQPSREVPQEETAKPAQTAAALLLLLVSLALLSTVLCRNAANRDFISYWSSAKLLRAHASPYAGQVVLAIENAAGGGYREPFLLRNPPWALFLAAPLGYCNAPVAAFLWLVALIGLALLPVRSDIDGHCWREIKKPVPVA